MAKVAALQLAASNALTEFIGTLFLCLSVALAGQSDIAPVAIGCVLMVCVYAGGHSSGAHYNPAVTLAVLVRGSIGSAQASLHVVSQLAGAVVAVLLSSGLIDEPAYPATLPGSHWFSCLLCEVLITFALSSVVLHTATTKAQAGNSHFGLAIGFTVLSGAVSVGGISGGAFNPAVGSMSIFHGWEAASNVWLYWLGPLTGGFLAGLCFRAVAWSEIHEDGSPSQLQAFLAPCLVEMIGTMMLCFTVGTASGFLAPLAIGSMLMVMIYMGGWISGGHFNPAVTLAVRTRTLLGAREGAFSWQQALSYVIAQSVGAALGTLEAYVANFHREQGYPFVPHSSTPAQAFLGEVLGTFLLAYTVLNVATVKQVAGNSFFGLAIGMAVTAMACGIGSVSGGAFNPAVGMMGMFMGDANDFWIYLSACSLGALLAAGAFRVQNFQEFQELEAQPKGQADLEKSPINAQNPEFKGADLDKIHLQDQQGNARSETAPAELYIQSSAMAEV